MSKVDDELTRRFRRVERPVGDDGLFDDLVHRRHRRQSLQRVQAGTLAIAVLAATTAGFVALSLAFDRDDRVGGGIVSPVPIVPKTNGLLAFADGSSLYTVAPSSGAVTRLRGIPEGAWLMSWSPDGSQLAVAVFPPEGARELWIADADGSEATKIASADNISQPGWSPDGDKVVYAADAPEGSSIHVIDTDGTNDQTVGDVISGRDYFSADFSPDGTKILFDKGTDSGFGIFTMDADGTGIVRLSSGGSDYNPAWSPSGLQIVFTRQEEGAESDIFVMNADGSSVRRLTDGPPGDTNLYPTFSPDGTRIAYVSGKNGGPGGLVVMAADGSSPRTIVDEGVLGIAWQPLPAPTAPSTTLTPHPPTPEPTISPQPASGAVEVGLAFGLCHLQRMDGIDWYGEGTSGTAWTGARVTDGGGCPPPGEGEYVVAADLDGDGVAEPGGIGFLEGCLLCRPFAATDLSGDGVLELVVLEEASSTPSYSLYEVSLPTSERSPGIYNLFVAPPGYRDAGFPGGQPIRFSAGGDEGYSAAIDCEHYPEAPVLVVAWSNFAVDVDSTEDVYLTRLRLGPDGVFRVIGSDHFTQDIRKPLPIDATGPACGVDWSQRAS